MQTGRATRRPAACCRTARTLWSGSECVSTGKKHSGCRCAPCSLTERPPRVVVQSHCRALSEGSCEDAGPRLNAAKRPAWGPASAGRAGQRAAPDARRGAEGPPVLLRERVIAPGTCKRVQRSSALYDSGLRAQGGELQGTSARASEQRRQLVRVKPPVKQCDTAAHTALCATAQQAAVPRLTAPGEHILRAHGAQPNSVGARQRPPVPGRRLTPASQPHPSARTNHKQRETAHHLMDNLGESSGRCQAHSDHTTPLVLPRTKLTREGWVSFREQRWVNSRERQGNDVV
jgi:hypothetical protein